MNFPSFKYIVVIYFILGFHGLFVYPKIVLAEIPKNFPPTLFIIEPKKIGLITWIKRINPID